MSNPRAVVTVFFFRSQKLSGSSKPGMCMMTDFVDVFISISNLLNVFNSAANFLVYMLKGKKFRAQFRQTYFGGCSNGSKGMNSPHRPAVGGGGGGA